MSGLARVALSDSGRKVMPRMLKHGVDLPQSHATMLTIALVAWFKTVSLSNFGKGLL